MKKSLIAAAAAALFLVSSAQAVNVHDCKGDTDRVGNIAHPWDKNTKVFHNGLVRITKLDTGDEPVCCSAHLHVLFPSPGQDEPVYQECRLVGSEDELGFLSLDFDKLTAKYDPKTGLDITFPYTVYDDSKPKHPSGVAKLRLDLKKGELKVVK